MTTSIFEIYIRLTFNRRATYNSIRTSSGYYLILSHLSTTTEINYD